MRFGLGFWGGWRLVGVFFFFNDTATTEIYTLSLPDALPISAGSSAAGAGWQLAQFPVQTASRETRMTELAIGGQPQHLLTHGPEIRATLVDA